jgi:thioredoxin
MKNIILILLGLIFSFNVVAQKQDVDPNTFQQHISNTNVQVLDVRTPGEYNSGHIKNALLADWTNKSDFNNGVKYLDKSKPVLVYCASGGRSAQAAQWLAGNGFKQVENLKGGFNEWKFEKKPYDAPANVVQLTIDQYYTSLKGDKPVLVDFGAEWCPPCKKMQPTLDALQNEMKNKFKFVKVDGGINTALMQQLDVSTLPTFIVYKHGKEVWRKQGIVEKDELKKQLSD